MPVVAAESLLSLLLRLLVYKNPCQTLQNVQLTPLHAFNFPFGPASVSVSGNQTSDWRATDRASHFLSECQQLSNLNWSLEKWMAPSNQWLHAWVIICHWLRSLWRESNSNCNQFIYFFPFQQVHPRWFLGAVRDLANVEGWAKVNSGQRRRGSGQRFKMWQTMHFVADN